jgi:tetratricopeptide (TPR) repeat protein
MTSQAARAPHPILHAFGIHSFARAIAMLLATTTMLMAVFTFLNVKADGNSKRFDATAQRRSIEALTLETNGKTQVSFDWGTAYRTWKELDTASQSAEKAKDAPEAERLIKLRNAVRNESALLSDNYFRNANGAPGTAPAPDLARYEAELYYKREQRLSEEALNLADIKSFWDGQVNRYITVLAFLSAALFIGGLALTVPRRVAGVLVVLSLIMIVGGTLYGANAVRNKAPLIPGEALDAYAEGQATFHLAAGESDEEKRLTDYDDAISQFSKALQIHGDYANALSARAEAYTDKGLLQFQTNEEDAATSFRAAVADYHDAQARGQDDAPSNWNLGWVYYLLGQFDDAIAADRRALQQDPSLFGVRSNMGLAYLASGRFDEGEREIMQAADEASKGIIAALLVKTQPPASSWSLLEAIGADLDNLHMRMDGNDWFFNEAPPSTVVRDLDRVKAKAAELRDRIANLTVSLEETGKLPVSTPPTATVTNITVGSVATRSSDRFVRGPELPYETIAIELQFRYEGMRRGQKVVWRVFHNGQQDRLLGRHREWDLGASGNGVFTMSYEYSSLYHFSSGYYFVELFIDQQLVGRTSFTVQDDG